MRIVFIYLPLEFEKKFPKGTIIYIVKLLYGIAEASVY